MHISGAPSTGGGNVSSSLMPNPSSPLVERAGLGMIRQPATPGDRVRGHPPRTRPRPMADRKGRIRALGGHETTRSRLPDGIRAADKGTHTARAAHSSVRPGLETQAMPRQNRPTMHRKIGSGAHSHPAQMNPSRSAGSTIKRTGAPSMRRCTDPSGLPLCPRQTRESPRQPSPIPPGRPSRCAHNPRRQLHVSCPSSQSRRTQPRLSPCTAPGSSFHESSPPRRSFPETLTRKEHWPIVQGESGATVRGRHRSMQRSPVSRRSTASESIRRRPATCCRQAGVSNNPFSRIKNHHAWRAGCPATVYPHPGAGTKELFRRLRCIHKNIMAAARVENYFHASREPSAPETLNCRELRRTVG